MAAKTFHLVPFNPAAVEIDLSISGRVTLAGTRLTIAYWLSGNLDEVAIAPADSKIELGSDRRDRLWEQTCFEFFLTSTPKPAMDQPYWEFNLSPSRAWNVFALDGYRQGIKEETTILDLPIEVERKSNSLCLTLRELDISSLIGDGQTVDQTADQATGRHSNQLVHLGISAVVILKTGKPTFWAITHPEPEANFHHSRSFVLSLERWSGP